jgi:hypothetical protein
MKARRRKRTKGEEASRTLSGGVVGLVGCEFGGVKDRYVRYEQRVMEMARRMEGRSGDVNADELVEAIV